MAPKKGKMCRDKAHDLWAATTLTASPHIPKLPLYDGVHIAEASKCYEWEHAKADSPELGYSLYIRLNCPLVLLSSALVRTVGGTATGLLAIWLQP